MDDELYPQVGKNGIEDDLPVVGADGLIEEDLPRVGADGVEEDENGRKKVSVAEASGRTRRNILHTAAGAYLIYTSIKLFGSFRTYFAESGWMRDTYICLIGSIVFAIISAVLLIGVVIRIVRNTREMKGDS